ncbi:TRAP-type mannitol/chloroaromatic compound transport system permease small subunit [Alkalispirillum mobile]|uniref:TRAP transporter small permease protein n=1 Tax=Alkalispirillum mobile TaxID=85925 RepID=A0A498C6A4_9GAMM|nr:TRAP transporter small permease subunit [Alkalispirillum mobile]RLK50883.1 TRAP-type mannitol/chloroaromatic compound transport system permease small subunit [Alkalispirillum mobile]
MLRTTLFLETWLHRISGLAGLLAGVALVAMVMLVFGNVVARYAFGFGAVWAQELEWYLLAFSAMLGIAYAMRNDDHVRVDIISHRFNRTGTLWLNFLTALLVALPCAALIIYFGYPFAESSFVRGERSPNSSGLPWRFIPKALVVVGFVFVAIEALAQTLTNGRKLVYHYHALWLQRSQAAALKGA